MRNSIISRNGIYRILFSVFVVIIHQATTGDGRGSPSRLVEGFGTLEVATVHMKKRPEGSGN